MPATHLLTQLNINLKGNAGKPKKKSVPKHKHVLTNKLLAQLDWPKSLRSKDSIPTAQLDIAHLGFVVHASLAVQRS